MKRKLALTALILMLALALAACGGTADPGVGDGDAAGEAAVTCTVQISCTNALAWDDLDQAVADLQPEDGLIVDTTVELAEGATALDALTAVLQEADLSYQLGQGDGYISAVNGLNEGDCGDLSGWLYSVNGESPMFSCNEYVLEDGDLVKLEYTCDMGADLGFSWE